MYFQISWESIFLLEHNCFTMLVSAVKHRGSALCIHTFSSLFNLSPTLPPHPSRPSQSTELSSLCCTAASCYLPILHMETYICHCCTLNSSHPHSPTVSTSLFSISVSPLLPCKKDHQYHLSRNHIYMLIKNMCFSLPELLLSV